MNKDIHVQLYDYILNGINNNNEKSKNMWTFLANYVFRKGLILLSDHA